MLALAAPLGAFASTERSSLRARDNHRRPSVQTENHNPAPAGTAPSATLQLDDGSYEVNIGIVEEVDPPSFGSQAVYLNRFTPSTDVLPLTLDTVSILFPESNSDLDPGMSFEILVYTDSSGSGNPANTTLVRRQAIHISPSDTVFQNVPLDSPVTVASGDVWIGFTNTVTRTTEVPIYPGAIDTGVNQERSWIFFDSAPHHHFNGDSLASAPDFGVLENSDFAGNWMIRASGQSGAAVELSWEDPDPSEGTGGAPRFLTATPIAGKLAADAASAEPHTDALATDPAVEPATKTTETAGGATVIAFKIYKSATSPVTPDPANIFATVPPNQHSAQASASTRGSFFIATACFADGSESPPSNEASGGIPAATLISLKVTTAKIAAGGSGFTSTVEVFLDNLGFVTPAKVKKNNRKVVQKGTLENGQTIAQYLTHGREVLISFRNSDGGIASAKFTVP